MSHLLVETKPKVCITGESPISPGSKFANYPSTPPGFSAEAAIPPSLFGLQGKDRLQRRKYPDPRLPPLVDFTLDSPRGAMTRAPLTGREAAPMVPTSRPLTRVGWWVDFRDASFESSDSWSPSNRS